ncbi:uncharacterized protein LOC125855817 [Solanum stenotomum]|uniref:uncharacterized protein LOC125855817 n=1 Tax=Solanum stenotomum TaxID=172797 RepID=UPI0020D0AB6D|nr:uncharacterized protein LOC125855817 [Solanum stenotomum]
MRNDDEDDILHTGRLLQQYSVDEYIKSETQRLDFVLYNPDLFRMSIYQGLLDILRLGERNSSNVGKQTFLPNSFIGGPTDMRQRYMDVIALVQHFDSTLETAAESCLPTLETLTAKGCLQYTVVVKTKKTTNNIKRLRSDYVELKKIPPCKFCNAKRFEYEPPGFCSGKGHDKIAFCVQNSDTSIEINEVKEYQSARWISPPEAVWRLFGFAISEMSTSVYLLQLHLECQQFVSFKSNADINANVNNP